MSLRSKVFLYFFGTFFLMLIIIAFFQYQREKEFRTQQLDQQLTTYNLITHRYLNDVDPDWDELKNYVRFFPDSMLRVTVIDTLGKVTFDSFVRKDTLLENHYNRPEIAMARESKNGKAHRQSVSTGLNYYYVAHKFNDCYIRSALPYNVTLITALKANTNFLNFMLIVLVIGVVVLYYISRNLTLSVERLSLFTRRAEQGKVPDTELDFPNDDLGEISKNIVHLYKMLLETKAQVDNERDKLISHIQVTQEGLAIFSSDKKEILANSNFIQYTNIISDIHLESSNEIFDLPEFSEITDFVDSGSGNQNSEKKSIIIEKNSRVFSVQCVVFQDDTFEITINDITVQNNEMELKRHLTQNISHELKTPVASIMGYMESILANPDLEPSRQKFFIERSFKQASRLRDLLQDISTLNKLDDGRRSIRKDECNLSDIVGEVLNDLQLEIEQKKFVVQKNIPSQLPINGNKSLLYSIFRNLLDNSLAYAGENISIEINCYREDELFYYFTVSDNGVGVGEEHLSKLFERFYRVDKGRTRKLGGTGLGLAIVKNAVMFHSGNISAKKSPVSGLSFLFSLKKN